MLTLIDYRIRDIRRKMKFATQGMRDYDKEITWVNNGPGEPEQHSEYYHVYVLDEDSEDDGQVICRDVSEADAIQISTLNEDFEFLLGELERLKAELRIAKGEPSSFEGLPPGYYVIKRLIYWDSNFQDSASDTPVWFWECRDEYGVCDEEGTAHAQAWAHYSSKHLQE